MATCCALANLQLHSSNLLSSDCSASNSWIMHSVLLYSSILPCYFAAARCVFAQCECERVISRNLLLWFFESFWNDWIFPEPVLRHFSLTCTYRCGCNQYSHSHCHVLRNVSDCHLYLSLNFLAHAFLLYYVYFLWFATFANWILILITRLIRTLNFWPRFSLRSRERISVEVIFYTVN